MKNNNRVVCMEKFPSKIWETIKNNPEINKILLKEEILFINERLLITTFLPRTGRKTIFSHNVMCYFIVEDRVINYVNYKSTSASWYGITNNIIVINVVVEGGRNYFQNNKHFFVETYLRSFFENMFKRIKGAQSISEKKYFRKEFDRIDNEFVKELSYLHKYTFKRKHGRNRTK